MSFFSLIGCLFTAAWLYLAYAHGAFWKILLPERSIPLLHFPSVDIIVPARNEAESLPHSLPSLLQQDYAGNWRVILVNDHSSDGTAELARQIAADLYKSQRLKVISAPDLEEGWAGKVAALHAGVKQSEADMILFTDADIRHAPQSLSHLVARAESGKYDLVSRMVKLHCESFAEKLLIPAFVFFFAMLYPFRSINNLKSPVAAAAGGTMLVRRQILDIIGGMAAIKSALIDDCALAKAIKKAGGKIELTLTEEIDSLRPYPHIADVWKMIARTAYTQLNYSPFLLAGTILGMALLYLLPVAFFLFAPTGIAVIAGILAFGIMAGIYMPMLKFYAIPRIWALTLPVAAFVYLAATLDSAHLYYKGQGGQWKGRAQA